MTDSLHLEIESAEVSHIEEVVRLAEECRVSRWTVPDYRNEIANPMSIFLVARGENALIVGFIVGRILADAVEDSYIAEIFNIAVAAQYRRLEVGSKLIRYFFGLAELGEAKQVFLEVRSGNTTAIEFYRKHGFEAYSRRNSYYTEPVEDATLMRMTI